ncbi:MAG: hypothetical protein HC836_39980 [Richelia sp. RM2_1_2]|nr:hypothetical protein [Richelia sp. RM2_1_2]
MRYREITESLNMGGLEYEQRVWTALKIAASAVDGLEVYGNAPSTAGFDNTSPDIVMLFNDQEMFIEVKKDDRAQTGGTSVRYNAVTGEATIVADVDDKDFVKIVDDIIASKKPDLDAFIAFIKQQEPQDYHSKITGFAMSVTKDAWTKAQKAGLLLPLNVKIVKDTSFIAAHYQRKGINYMQIGGSGLFYLKNNPLNLPIPKLEGVVTVEMRPARSGSRLRTVNGNTISVSGGNIRLQGRLKFTATSPYTLDDPQSVIELFS